MVGFRWWWEVSAHNSPSKGCVFPSLDRCPGNPNHGSVQVFFSFFFKYLPASTGQDHKLLRLRRRSAQNDACLLSELAAPVAVYQKIWIVVKNKRKALK